MQVTPPETSWMTTAGHACEIGSAIFGLCGTWLMSRRYVRIDEAIVFVWKVVRGKEKNARQFFISRAKLNEGVADSAADMSLGVILVFWGFFFQLVSFLFK